MDRSQGVGALKLASALIACVPPTDTGGLPDGPTVPGTLFQGGYYAGRLLIDGKTYAILVCPKANEGDTLAYRTALTAFAGNVSTFDGPGIRDEMIAVGIAQFPAQQWCVNLSIAGYTDWYLPSRDEIELIYRYLKPTTGTNVTNTGANTVAVPVTGNYVAGNPVQTASLIFRSTGAQKLESGYYWSATRGNAATNAGTRRMTTGAIYIDDVTETYAVRAVRRVQIAA